MPLPKTVVGLGLVSLFTDVSSEAIFPLLPAFLTTLGASNAFIGLVEGAAELVANVLKYLTGLVADRRARLKPLVLVGYGISTVVRPLVAFAARPVARARRARGRSGRQGRAHQPARRAHRRRDGSVHPGAGLRLPPRHGPCRRGASAPCSAPACSGGWARSGGQAASGEQMRTVFLWAAVPGVLAMVALALTREPPRPPPAPAAPGESRALPPALRRALLPIVLFAFANATDAFILVKAARLGASPILAPLLWLALHVIKASTATAGGRLADRYGKRNALALGWMVYAVTWSAVGFAETVPLLFVLGRPSTAPRTAWSRAPEKALVAELAAGERQGQGLRRLQHAHRARRARRRARPSAWSGIASAASPPSPAPARSRWSRRDAAACACRRARLRTQRRRRLQASELSPDRRTR